MTPVRKLLALHALAGGAPLSEYTETGNPVSFNTNVAKPLSVLAAFSPVQSGTGDPSPDNVRPITGWSGAKVTRSGKNMFSYNADNVKQETTSSSTTRAVYHTGIISDGSTKFTFSAYPKTPGTLTTAHINVGYYENGIATAIDYFIRADGADYTPTLSLSAGREVIIMYTDTSVSAFKTNLEKYNIQIEIGSSASTFEEYTGQSVSVTFPALGKNLADVEYGSKKPNLSTGEMGNADGWSCEFIPIEQGQEYYCSGLSGIGTTYFLYYSSDGSYLGYSYHNANFSPNADTLFASANMVRIRNDSSEETSVQIMFEKGSTASPYEPYNATAYGGTLDLSTGVLTVEWFAYTFDGTERIVENSGYTGTGGKRYDTQTLDFAKAGDRESISDKAVSLPQNPTTVTVFAFRSGSGIARTAFYVPDNLFEGENNETNFKAWLAENKTTICEHYSTPLVYQLTPAEILSLVGDNVIWSDLNGQLTVVYKKKG